MRDTNKMRQPFVLSFKEDIILCEKPDGGAWLQSSGGQVPLSRPSPGMLSVLRALSSDGATVEQLIELFVQQDGAAALPRLLSDLQRFIQRGMLCHTVTWNGTKLATLVPLTPTYQYVLEQPVSTARYVMSRFAYLHNTDEQFVLESPLAYAKILLHDRQAMAFLQVLAKPRNIEELCREFRNVPPIMVTLFVGLLLGGHVLSRIGDNERAEEEKPALTQWDFHDLLFHTRSRIGRHANPLGATFRFSGVIEPLPAVKTLMSGEKICLYKPDIEALKYSDIPFTRVLEERRSIRRSGEQPITAAQLGEFLYRTARLRARSQQTYDGYERSDRPYPSGGACYELEVYVVVNACVELMPGLYHYCPLSHQLSKMTGRTHALEMLLESAYYAADQQGMPQILFLLAARFQRVAWKYESMAYALSLKHVGVLYQTMYLVAEAMGLAACALGSGDSDLFAAAAGTDYYAETSIGEFILGSRAEE